MKIIEIHITTYGIPGADTDSEHYFTKDDAINAAIDKAAHLTDSECQNYIVSTEGYTVRLPDDYTVTTADQLDLDLCNGDVESPDFDPCTAQYISKQLYYNEHIAR